MSLPFERSRYFKEFESITTAHACTDSEACAMGTRKSSFPFRRLTLSLTRLTEKWIASQIKKYENPNQYFKALAANGENMLGFFDREELQELLSSPNAIDS